MSASPTTAYSEGNMLHNDGAVSNLRLFILCLIAATLVMGAGWGIRGSFGHSRGAMMPGAMLGLVIIACSGRPDWWQRAPLVGLMAGIGWAFGGASSYGLLVGYTLKPELTTSIYGYFSLMLVGALYSGIGCGFLGLSLTKSRRFLESALWPMVLLYTTWMILDWSGAMTWSLQLFAKDPDRPEYTPWLFDTHWLYALASIPVGALLFLVPRWRGPATMILVLSTGWWLSISLLIGALGLRINPSRNDSWAGVLGIMLGLIAYLIWKKNRAAMMMVGFGLVSGAIGFPLGQFLQALGRFRWGPMGSMPFLAELDHWTLMEQTFGYCMGLGAALGCMRLTAGHLAAADEDRSPGWLNPFSVWILLGLMLMLNVETNYRRWIELELLKPLAMELSTSLVLCVAGLVWLVFLAWVIWQQERGKIDLLPASSLGRSQLLALTVLLAVMLLYMLLPSLRLPTWLMIFTALLVGALCVLSSRGAMAPKRAPQDCQSRHWSLGWGFAGSVVILFTMISSLGYLTINIPRP